MRLSSAAVASRVGVALQEQLTEQAEDEVRLHGALVHLVDDEQPVGGESRGAASPKMLEHHACCHEEEPRGDLRNVLGANLDANLSAELDAHLLSDALCDRCSGNPARLRDGNSAIGASRDTSSEHLEQMPWKYGRLTAASLTLDYGHVVAAHRRIDPRKLLRQDAHVVARSNAKRCGFHSCAARWSSLQWRRSWACSRWLRLMTGALRCGTQRRSSCGTQRRSNWWAFNGCSLTGALVAFASAHVTLVFRRACRVGSDQVLDDLCSDQTIIPSPLIIPLLAHIPY